MIQTFAHKPTSLPFAPVPRPVLQRKCACGGNPGPSGECEACRKKPLGTLQRSAAGLAPASIAPPLVHDVLSSPGQPLDPATRSFMEPRFGHDFGQVRVHTDVQAARSAQSVNAAAYTVGQNVVFGAEQYTPHTNAGNRLLAHELTHTIQQGSQPPAGGRTLEIGTSFSSFEREADCAAAQVTAGRPARSIAAAGAGALLQRQPANAGAFDNETPALQTRRLEAIGALRNAINRLSKGLAGGHLWAFESVTSTGIDVTPILGLTLSETVTARTARVRKILTDLNQIVSQLESAPIPAQWLTSPVVFPGKGTFTATGPQAWQDAQMFYVHRNVAQGMDLTTTNLFYIETDPIPTKKTRPVAIDSGIQTGNFIVVPNPDKEPLVYQRLGHEGTWNSGEEAIEVWSDSLGHYYLGKDGSRHYLPNWPN